MSVTETNMVALRREVALLRADVQGMQAELDRRDIEQIEIEGAIEYLERRGRTHHSVLGVLVTLVLGRTDRSDGKMYFERLYPCPGPTGPNGAGEAIAWQRPRRRWAQFGSLGELVAVAESNGIKLTSDERRHRDMLVRRLWRARLLPGSVDLHGERLLRERAA